MVKILKLKAIEPSKIIEESKKVIENSGVIIYPTDTVYGIGGDATNMDVVRKVREIKGIEKTKPLSVIMSDLKMIKEYCELGSPEELTLKKYLPGPYTFILRLNRPIPVTSDLTIGVRIPEHNFSHQLSEAVEKPIISTSANKTGEEPPRSFEEVDKSILEKADLAIDGGFTRYSGPSDVIDLVNRKVIRKGIGVIDISEIMDF